MADNPDPVEIKVRLTNQEAFLNDLKKMVSDANREAFAATKNTATSGELGGALVGADEKKLDRYQKRILEINRRIKASNIESLEPFIRQQALLRERERLEGRLVDAQGNSFRTFIIKRGIEDNKRLAQGAQNELDAEARVQEKFLARNKAREQQELERFNRNATRKVERELSQKEKAEIAERRRSERADALSERNAIANRRRLYVEQTLADKETRRRQEAARRLAEQNSIFGLFKGQGAYYTRLEIINAAGLGGLQGRLLSRILGIGLNQAGPSGGGLSPFVVGGLAASSAVTLLITYVALLRQTITTAQDLRNEAEKLGISFPSLRGLRAGETLSDAKQGSLSGAVKKIRDLQTKAQAGDIEAQRTLGRIGVTSSVDAEEGLRQAGRALRGGQTNLFDVQETLGGEAVHALLAGADDLADSFDKLTATLGDTSTSLVILSDAAKSIVNQFLLLGKVLGAQLAGAFVINKLTQGFLVGRFLSRALELTGISGSSALFDTLTSRSFRASSARAAALDPEKLKKDALDFNERKKNEQAIEQNRITQEGEVKLRQQYLTAYQRVQSLLAARGELQLGLRDTRDPSVKADIRARLLENSKDLLSASSQTQFFRPNQGSLASLGIFRGAISESNIPAQQLSKLQLIELGLGYLPEKMAASLIRLF